LRKVHAILLRTLVRVTGMTSPTSFNEFISTRSYVSGFQYSGADSEALQKVGKVTDPKLVHLNRWASHVTATQGATMSPPRTASEIRRSFIDYFINKREHIEVHSSSVVPHDDPTLLFANAGMNQFKPIFLGTVDPNSDMSRWKRVVNSQKCIRAGGKHNDLDDVGKDVYHHTFFEMKGNWSFGDYFKKEIIEWSWDLLTNVWCLDKDRLYVTYFGGDEALGLAPDDEAKDYWISMGLPSNRVLPFDCKDNFWEMGETGPCGPCSEIHYDRIGNREVPELVNMDDPDVLEIWNLVFIQFNREPDQSLSSLPAKHIDCGLGLERVVSVLQNKTSNYDTDLFMPLFAAIQEGTGARPYTGKVGAEDVDGLDMAYRVLADHARTLTIAICDGGLPDNVGRGYVLRRILRRAVRYAVEKLGAKPGFFASLVLVVNEILKDEFPELLKDPQYTMDVINEEEEQFLKTLNHGKRLFEKTVKNMSGTVIPGDVAWRLYDTYGFPSDLTTLMAEERSLSVDIESFNAAKLQAQEMSRGGGGTSDDHTDIDVHAISELQKMGIAPSDDSHKYNYTSDAGGNYEFSTVSGTVKALRVNSELVKSAKSGDRVGVVLDRTSFYAEQGGQVYDTGFMVNEADDGNEMRVTDVQVKAGYVIHKGIVEGSIALGDVMKLSIDTPRRRRIMNNHTATHLLNYGLRQYCGDADQRGSLVTDDKLRFDFSYKTSLTTQQLEGVDRVVSEFISANQPVYAKEAPLALAKEIQGLRAMFDETYPDPVRVISVGIPVETLVLDPSAPAGSKTSVEFCGGTHINKAGDMNKFTVVSEKPISKGVRRIIALTGGDAEKAIARGDALQSRADLLTAEFTSSNYKYQEIIGMINVLIQENDKVMIPAFRRDTIRDQMTSVKAKLDKAKIASEKPLVVANGNEIKQLVSENKSEVLIHVLQSKGTSKGISEGMKDMRKRAPDTAAVILGVNDDEVFFHCIVPKKLSSNLKADQWLASFSPLLSARCGGKDLYAQGSGKGAAKIDEVVRIAKQFAEMKMK